jgi:hypothetical protein
MSYKITFKVQKTLPADVEVEVDSLEEATKTEQDLITAGFVNPFQRKAGSFQSTKVDSPRKDLSNIEADGEMPICEMHKSVMDRKTKNGKPYHNFNGKNCSGEGWWPTRG